MSFQNNNKSVFRHLNNKQLISALYQIFKLTFEHIHTHIFGQDLNFYSKFKEVIGEEDTWNIKLNSIAQ